MSGFGVFLSNSFSSPIPILKFQHHRSIFLQTNCLLLLFYCLYLTEILKSTLASFSYYFCYYYCFVTSYIFLFLEYNLNLRFPVYKKRVHLLYNFLAEKTLRKSVGLPSKIKGKIQQGFDAL